MDLQNSISFYSCSTCLSLPRKGKIINLCFLCKNTDRKSFFVEHNRHIDYTANQLPNVIPINGMRMSIFATIVYFLRYVGVHTMLHWNQKPQTHTGYTYTLALLQLAALIQRTYPCINDNKTKFERIHGMF